MAGRLSFEGGTPWGCLVVAANSSRESSPSSRRFFAARRSGADRDGGGFQRCCRRVLILVQLVFEAVDQRDPTGLDDVFTYAHGAPHLILVAAFDDHTHARRRAGFGIDDAYLVIDKL